MLNVELYTTEHCSLCEQALDLLLGLPEMGGVTLTTVDISASDALMESYGERIPVLRAENAELAAPFGRAEVVAFLQSLSS